MPFSFSNITPAVLMLMIAVLSIAEAVKYIRKRIHHQ